MSDARPCLQYGLRLAADACASLRSPRLAGAAGLLLTTRGLPQAAGRWLAPPRARFAL